MNPDTQAKHELSRFEQSGTPDDSPASTDAPEQTAEPDGQFPESPRETLNDHQGSRVPEARMVRLDCDSCFRAVALTYQQDGYQIEAWSCPYEDCREVQKMHLPGVIVKVVPGGPTG